MASAAVAAGDDAVGQQQPRKGSTGGGSGTPPPPPAEQELRCPRCDSPNTKFCYYNNYSLSQPRHFCKTCRRYWTKGGALRNVPVGGGCRKNKRSRSAASSSSRGLSLNLPAAVESIDAASDQHATRMGGGFPGGDFHGVVGMLPGLHHSPAVVSHYVPFGEWPSGGGDVNGGHAMNGSGAGGNGAMGSSTIASSIESLSFINQDLHWKLQQQRVATMFLGPPSSSSHSHSHVDGGGGHIAAGAQFGGGGTFLQMDTVPAATSWFMDSSYALPSPPPPAAAIGTTSSNINSGRSSGGAADDNATSDNNNNCGSAMPSWGDISTFAMLP